MAVTVISRASVWDLIAQHKREAMIDAAVRHAVRYLPIAALRILIDIGDDGVGDLTLIPEIARAEFRRIESRDNFCDTFKAMADSAASDYEHLISGQPPCDTVPYDGLRCVADLDIPPRPTEHTL